MGDSVDYFGAMYRFPSKSPTDILRRRFGEPSASAWYCECISCFDKLHDLCYDQSSPVVCTSIVNETVIAPSVLRHNRV